jgi:Spy/CpxP family protein refolding chaperone
MSSRKLWSRILLTAGLALAFTGGAFAQETPSAGGQQQGPPGAGDRGPRGRREGGPRNGGAGMIRVFEELNLSDTQKQQIGEIRKSSDETIRPKREELRRLQSQSESGPLSAEDQAKRDQLRADLKAEQQKTHDAIVALLTPEQRTKLEQLEQQRKANRPGGGPREKSDQQ